MSHPSSSVAPGRRRFRLLLLGVAAALMAGCAAQLPAPTANGETVEKIRALRLPPARAGNFVLAPGKAPALDRSVGGLRGSTLSAASGSFAQQLKDELVQAMKAAGVYDESSPTVIESQLVDSSVDAGISTGSARLAARFIVSREGQKRFDKELVVESTWESSFVGAVALPMAINQYGALYKAIVIKLVGDPDFRLALASRP